MAEEFHPNMLSGKVGRTLIRTILYRRTFFVRLRAYSEADDSYRKEHS